MLRSPMVSPDRWVTLRRDLVSLRRSQRGMEPKVVGRASCSCKISRQCQSRGNSQTIHRARRRFATCTIKAADKTWSLMGQLEPSRAQSGLTRYMTATFVDDQIIHHRHAIEQGTLRTRRSSKTRRIGRNDVGLNPLQDKISDSTAASSPGDSYCRFSCCGMD